MQRYIHGTNERKIGKVNGKEILSCEYDEITTLEGIENSLIITKDGKKVQKDYLKLLQMRFRLRSFPYWILLLQDRDCRRLIWRVLC